MIYEGRWVPTPINPEPWAFGCAGKEAFPGPVAARKVLKRIERRHCIKNQQAKGTLEPYRCPECGKWHIGTGLHRRG